MRGGPNYTKATQALVDAARYGDQEASKRNGVGVRTIEKWRARMREDPELHRRFAEKFARVDAKVDERRAAFEIKALDFLEAVVERGNDLLAKAKPEQFGELAEAVRDVSEAVRNVGELGLAAKVLGVGNRSGQSGEAAAEAGPSSDAPEAGDGDDPDEPAG